MANVSSSNGLEKRPKLRFPGFNEPWSIYKAEELFKNVADKNHPTETVLTIIQGKGTLPREQAGRNIHYDDSSLANYKKVEQGDFIIHLRSFEGGLEMANEDGIVSPAYTILRCKKPHSSLFYEAYFHTDEFINHILSKSVEGIRDGRQISYEAFKWLGLPYCDVSEQEKIAQLFCTLSRRIEKQQQMVDDLKKYKRGLLRKFFITDEWNTHSQWEKCKLGVYCSKIGSGKTPRGGSSVYTDHGVMFLRSQNVLWGSLDIRDVSYIDEATNKTMLSSEVRCKDVLLNITGASIGRSCIYLLNDRANVNQHVCIIRLSQEGKERLLPEFLLQQILSDHIQQQIIDCQNGGSREGLNFQQIADFNIVLPSIKEQQVICGILNSFDQKILCEEATLNCLHTLRVSLMQQLFI